jgi:tight adherence protein C
MAILLLLAGVGALFLGITLAMTAVGTDVDERRAVGRSLAAVEAIRSAPDEMKKDLDKPFTDRVITPAMEQLTTLGRRFTPDDQAARIRRKLDLAGNPTGWDVNRIIAFKMLGLFAGAVVGLMLGLLVGSSPLVIIGLIIGSAVLGYFAPSIALYQSAYNRTEQMRKDLPDALDLLTISVEAGMAFDSAVSQVARNTRGPLADEFFRVLQEMQIGLSRAEAIRAMGDRTDLSELRNFASAMVQADTLGIPVASVLRVQANEMRVKRSQRAEEQAQRVPVKILFPLIFCILPVLFIIILGPAAITIFESFSGTL